MPREGGESLISAASVGMAAAEGQRSPIKKEDRKRVGEEKHELSSFFHASKMGAESEEARAVWNGRESWGKGAWRRIDCGSAHA